MPNGFPNLVHITKICKIDQALYVLKQVFKSWYERINAWLLSQGLIGSESNPNLYYSMQDEKNDYFFLSQ